MQSYETSGERIRRLMRNLTLSHQDLADRAGLGADYVLQVIQDATGVPPAIRERIQALLTQHNVPHEVWEKLANALGTTPEYLETGRDPWLNKSMHSLERFIAKFDLGRDEAQALRTAIQCAKWKSTDKPLREADFRALLKEIRRRQIPVTGWVICNHCQKIADADLEMCPHCGHVLNTGM